MTSVLIVDDSSLVRDFLRRVLGRLGFRVIEAEDGFEAFRLARDRQPSIVLMDVLMPGMDGYETAEMFKGDPRTRDIPLVALTSLRLEEDLQEARSRGFDGCVTKPFRLRSLQGLVERILETYGILTPPASLAAGLP